MKHRWKDEETEIETQKYYNSGKQSYRRQILEEADIETEIQRDRDVERDIGGRQRDRDAERDIGGRQRDKDAERDIGGRQSCRKRYRRETER